MAPRNAKPKRPLPALLNPELLPERSPDYEKLISERRLGQTNLAVRTNQVGTSNATKKENLGPLDYAYLKIPFPENFKGSEIHPHTAKHGPPTSYFLMVRESRDFWGPPLTVE
ncbi:MAG: hypothetical protein Q9206_003675 [Seirophora lacunosa]